MRFLIIDASGTMRRITANALQRIGCTDVLEAADGHDALVSCDAGVGFIITEWNVAGMGGANLVAAVRSKPWGHGVPILMVTTRDAADTIVAAIEAGANDYILKPFTPSVLKEKIDRLLASVSAAA